MNDLKKWTIASCLVFSLMSSAQTAAKKTNADPLPAPAARHASTRVIVVSLADRRLALVEDGAVTKVYKVAVGRTTTPSPTGTFTIVHRVENPTYYHDGVATPPGPGNPVGTR